MPQHTVFITDNGDTPFVVHLPFNGNVSTHPGTIDILRKCKDEDELEDVERTDPRFFDILSLGNPSNTQRHGLV